MPYYDPSKPLVRSWFSATKRALRDCASHEALDGLRREHGLTVLYQYLHRYASPDTLQLDQEFTSSVRRIRAYPDILVAPVSTMMRRLRILHGVFVCSAGESHWALNINDVDARDVQLSFSGAERPPITLPPIPAETIVALDLPAETRIEGRNAVRLSKNLTAVKRVSAGTLIVNCSGQSAASRTATLIPAMSWRFFPSESVAHRPLSLLPKREEIRLLTAQSMIILREMMLRGRRFSTHAYLGGREIPLERHENW